MNPWDNWTEVSDMELVMAWVNNHAPHGAVPAAVTTLVTLFTTTSGVNAELVKRLGEKP